MRSNRFSLGAEFFDPIRSHEISERVQPRKITITLAFLMVSACFSLGQAQPGSGTGIEGVIAVSPIHPGPTREGVSNSGPLAKVVFTVENEKGIVTSFTTDDQGRFRVSLPPGHYTVSMKEKRHAIGRSGPFGVDVAAGKMTAVAWQCDSGMR